MGLNLGHFFWQPEKESFLQQRDNGGGKMLSFNGIVMILTFFSNRKVLLGGDVLRFTPGLRLEKGMPYPQVHR